MKVFYYKDPRGNFGDDINGWMWNLLLPDIWDGRDDHLFSGIGTIIGPFMHPLHDRQWTVFGSGAGYGLLPPGFGGPNWDIRCVRGPLTAKLLGLPEEKAVCDGAILLAKLPQFAPLPESERRGVVFMPHHHALDRGNWEEVSRRAGIEYISPRNDSVETLNRLRSAKLVIADAMHAAIVADTLRVPWVPVMTSPNISSFKWLDWATSLGLEYRPRAMPFSTANEAVRSAISLASGSSEAFAARDPEGAVRAYERTLARHASPLAKARRLWTLRVSRRTVIPWMDSRLRGKLFPRSDERHIDRAAAALRSSATATPFLSDDRKFDSALSNMSEHLEAFAADQRRKRA